MAKLGWTQTAWFRLFVVVLLVLGIFFCFVNLDRKVYWHDEAFTSLRIAGYTKAEILLSSAALLRAIRLPTQLNWGIYAATLALSLYSFLLSGLVAIAHCIYVAAIEGFRLSQKAVAYILAAIAALLAFVPWLFILFSNLSSVGDATDWATKKTPLISLIRTWIGNLSRLLFDLNFDSEDSLIALITPTVITIVLVIYSFYFLQRNSSAKKLVIYIYFNRVYSPITHRSRLNFRRKTFKR